MNKTLGEYLKFKPKCPFCDTDLKITIENHDYGGDHFISDFENHKEYIQFKLKVLLLTDKMVFKIKIYQNNKIKYYILENSNKTSIVFDQHFYDIFNLAYVYLDSSCVEKNCKVKYFINSDIITIYNKKIESFNPYIESINCDKFLIRNNFKHNKMQIYLTNSSTEPLETKFFNLTKETASLIFNRVKMVTTFA